MMINVRRSTPSSAQLDFRWRGGPYIDVFWVGGEVPDNVDAHHENGRGDEGDATPFSTINVWDYQTGEAEIPFTEDALVEKADAWIDENREDYGL
jgi:hypothetical protein